MKIEDRVTRLEVVLAAQIEQTANFKQKPPKMGVFDGCCCRVCAALQSHDLATLEAENKKL